VFETEPMSDDYNDYKKRDFPFNLGAGRKRKDSKTILEESKKMFSGQSIINLGSSTD